jgi:AcrR family transcriptional regulator
MAAEIATQPTALREPKQGRSRASFEKVIAAARTLMAESGYDGFTLADVVRTSGVSIGSIYHRVSSKDDLLRVLHTRVLEEIEVEQAWIVCADRWEGFSLHQMLPQLLDELAEMLRRVGRASGKKLAEGFEALLLTRRDAIRHPDPVRAAHACFTTAYATYSRYLGLGSSLDSAGEGDWQILKADVSLMCGCFLQFSQDELARHPEPAKPPRPKRASKPKA